jgi:hypothetical protein
MYWKSNLENPSNLLSEQEVSLKINDLEKFIRNNDLKKIKNGRDYIISLYRVYRDYLKNWPRTIELMEKSINLNQEFDIITYHDISLLLNNTRYPLSTRVLKQLSDLKDKAEKSFPGEVTYQKVLTIFPFGNADTLNFEELRLANKLIPGSSHVFIEYLHRVKQEKKLPQNQIVEFYKEALSLTGPFSPEYHDFIDELNEISTELKNEQSKKEIKKFLDNYFNYYPHLSKISKKMDQNILLDWIKYDLGKMIDILKDHKTSILIQNYHWLRGNKMESEISDTIKQVSLAKNIPFSNTRETFISAIKNSNLPEDAFFSTKFGIKDNHPSVLGHKVIAEKLFIDIENNHFISE